MKIKGSLCWLFTIPALAIAGCAFETGPETTGTTSEALEVDGGQCVLDPLSITVLESTQSTIKVRVCAGSSGAPEGFTLQWKPATSGHEFTGTECSATYKEQLACDACVDVLLGDFSEENGVCASCGALECGTDYVIRGRAEASCDCSESEYSCPVDGKTSCCEKVEEGCTRTQGYWKNHPDAWPVSSLTLGTVTYTQTELLDIFDEPVAGNGLIQLAHQLIAAKLNIASGASDGDISSTISDADALIDGLVIPPVGGGSLPTSETSELNDELADFNEGATGPGHCEDNDKVQKDEKVHKRR